MTCWTCSTNVKLKALVAESILAHERSNTFVGTRPDYFITQRRSYTSGRKDKKGKIHNNVLRKRKLKSIKTLVKVQKNEREIVKEQTGQRS